MRLARQRPRVHGCPGGCCPQRERRSASGYCEIALRKPQPGARHDCDCERWQLWFRRPSPLLRVFGGPHSALALTYSTFSMPTATPWNPTLADPPSSPASPWEWKRHEPPGSELSGNFEASCPSAATRFLEPGGNLHI